MGGAERSSEGSTSYCCAGVARIRPAPACARTRRLTSGRRRHFSRSHFALGVAAILFWIQSRSWWRWWQAKSGKARPGERAIRASRAPSHNEPPRSLLLAPLTAHERDPEPLRRAHPGSAGPPARLPQPWWQPREQRWRPFPSILEI